MSTTAGRTSPFDRIVVIFNPQSTGDAPRSADQLQAELASRLPRVPVEMRPTEHAGHARDLAADAARSGRPLIVSVSGDGGYNEVVDGVVQAGNEHAICAVKAAGNANDHRRTTAERPLVDAIVAGEVRRIDLLRLTVGDGAGARTRYAHSYIGMGLTPVVAIDLEKGGGHDLADRAHPAAHREMADPRRRDPGGDPRPRTATDRAALRVHHAQAHPPAARRRTAHARRGHVRARRHRPHALATVG